MNTTDKVRAALDQMELALSYYVHLATKAKTDNKWIACELYKVEETIDHIVRIRRELDDKAIVPVEPTRTMLNAAVDVDSYKLGDISPIGFRISPQQLFGKCYRAIIAPYVGGKDE